MGKLGDPVPEASIAFGLADEFSVTVDVGVDDPGGEKFCELVVLGDSDPECDGDCGKKSSGTIADRGFVLAGGAFFVIGFWVGEFGLPAGAVFIDEESSVERSASFLSEASVIPIQGIVDGTRDIGSVDFEVANYFYSGGIEGLGDRTPLQTLSIDARCEIC